MSWADRVSPQKLTPADKKPFPEPNKSLFDSCSFLHSCFSSSSSLPIRKVSFKNIYKESLTVRRFPLLTLLYPAGDSCSGPLLPQHTEAALFCSVVGGHVSRKQRWLPGHIQDCLEQGSMQQGRTEAASMVSPKCRGCWRKSGVCVPQWGQLKGDTKTPPFRVFPFLNVPPKSSTYKVIIFLSSFLSGHTVLHPNAYLEKAATSQIKLHRGSLAPKADRGNSAHPTSQSPQLNMHESGWKTWPKRLTHKSGHYKPFFLLNA